MHDRLIGQVASIVRRLEFMDVPILPLECSRLLMNTSVKEVIIDSAGF